ncbi:MAG: glycosyltransferase family 2 protein [Gammaproteobacteria bacterium]
MVSQPKISIITVCYNSQQTILDTIRSVQSQDYLNREHIIIDGESKDGTLMLLEQHRSEFDVLVSERDRGIYDAMNKGIRIASGDIIGFLNSDDIYYDKTSLSTIAGGFSEATTDAVFGNLIYVSKENLEKIVRFWRASSFQTGLFSKGWCPPHPTFYVKKAIYDRLGGFDISLPIANDVELMMRFLEVGKINTRHIDEVLVRMRMGGVSNNSLKNIVYQNYVILKSLQKHQLPSAWLPFIFAKLKSRTAQYSSKSCQPTY